MKQLYACIALLFSLSSFGQAGSLVTTFGTGGKVQTTISATQDGAAALLIQPDGKLVAGGFSYNAGNQDFALARYNTDGSLDVSFSGDGIQTTAIGTGNENITALARQADGKLVAVGQTRAGTTDVMGIVRYQTDGTLDPGFSGDGKLTATIGTLTAYAHAVAVQPDGKILVAGYTVQPGLVDFTVFRFLPDGTPDVSFSGDGIATVDYASTLDNAYAMVLQADGKILLAGNASANFMLARLNSDGSLDASFDGDGKVMTAISEGARLNAVAVQADGKIVAAGQRYYTDWIMDRTVYDAVVVRYLANGQVDATFNGTGRLDLDLGSDNDDIRSVALQNDGKILLGGYMNADFAVVRLQTNGTLDNSFDGDGKVFTHFASGEYIFALALNGNKIYAAGSANSHFGLAAYLNDALPLPVTLSGFGGNKQGEGVRLGWQTATEQNTSHFEIERSKDGRLFTHLGTVNAVGNTNTSKAYAFTDRYPASTVNYYRLKIVDADGVFSYSHIVQVRMEEQAKLDVYPNPSRQQFTVVNTTASNSTLQVRVTDVHGRLVEQRNNLAPGQSFQLGTRYKAGTYIINVLQDGQRKQLRVVKL